MHNNIDEGVGAINTIDILKEMEDLKKVLSYSKNIGFFFGAGTSCAFGLPDVMLLTQKVEDKLTEKMKKDYFELKKSLELLHNRNNISIEEILNYVRQIRDITGEREDRNYEGVSGKEAKELDEEICKYIFATIKEKEKEADILDIKRFFIWFNMINRDYVKEIFTTNYDMLLEKAMEENYIPYYDGFVGSYEPFFCPESIEKFVRPNDLTYNWIRLWKIHGSLNWQLKQDEFGKAAKIIRAGKVDVPENELVIYPSKEKYNLSRKQPFIAYFDRLKNYLLSGEILFVFSGYSFLDEHINEVIFNCLRQNPRLYVVVLCFSDDQVSLMEEYGSSHPNLCIMGPKKVVKNGAIYKWKYDDLDGNTDKSHLFWNKESENFILGDFKKLIDFLISNSGKGTAIEGVLNGK